MYRPAFSGRAYRRYYWHHGLQHGGFNKPRGLPQNVCTKVRTLTDKEANSMMLNKINSLRLDLLD